MMRRRLRARVAAEAGSNPLGAETGVRENSMGQDEVRDSQETSAQHERLEAARGLAAGGDLDGAIGAYRTLVLADPTAIVPRLELGRLHAAREEHTLALEQFEAARQVEDQNVDVIEAVALAQAALGRFDVAEKELRRLLRLQPEHAAAHGHLGMVAFRRGLYTEAEVYLKRALQLDPELAAGYFYRGEALNQIGQVDEALEMLERAVQLDPANARAYYVMGIVYDKKARPEEANAMYRKSREVAAG